MKKTLSIVALMLVASVAAFAQSKVYLTREITPNAQFLSPCAQEPCALLGDMAMLFP